MSYIIYFKSRSNMSDKSTWRKELLPDDTTIREVAMATKLGGCEGFAIVRNKELITFKWLNK